MARAIMPIVGIKATGRFSLDFDELFEQEGVKGDDEFTYTTRYTVPEAKREAIKARIRALHPDEADEFIALMDEHGWDVSFLVDTY